MLEKDIRIPYYLVTHITIFHLYTKITKANMLCHKNYKNSLSKCSYCIYYNIAKIHICMDNK